MKQNQSREQRMLEAARETARNYLLDDICDYDTIIGAVAEMLWEKFGVKDIVADNLAKKLIDPIWNDMIAEAATEIEESKNCYREREFALQSAREGRW